ncbi:MAG TPA: NAD-binding protein, partial [Burkholderiales bacterium]|nr:NAD-binding protein [Burkholderiales bacterium]
PVVITGRGDLAERLVRRCVKSGIPVCIIDSETEMLNELRRPGVAVVPGDAGQHDILKAAGLGAAKMIVVTNPLLSEKMRICVAARAVNPRIAIVATAGSDGERIWLEEFGAAFVCDALDEMADLLLRSIRSGL